MYSLQLKYKAETGELPYMLIEAEDMWDEITVSDLDDPKDVIETIQSMSGEECIKLEDVPETYLSEQSIKIPTPEYVEWLEEQAGSDNINLVKEIREKYLSLRYDYDDLLFRAGQWLKQNKELREKQIKYSK